MSLVFRPSGLEVAVKVIDKTKLDQRETEHLLKEVHHCSLYNIKHSSHQTHG